MTARSIGFGGAARSDGQKDVERLFSPEFRNRLDEIVTFKQLTPGGDGSGSSTSSWSRSRRSSRRRRSRSRSRPRRDAWLAEKGYDPLFGARPLARVIQTELKDQLADELLFGKLAKGGTANVDVADGALTFVCEPRAS